MNEFEYGAEVEITKVTIDSVEGKRLAQESFTEIIDAPKSTSKQAAVSQREITKEELIETLKHTIRDISNNLIAEEGIGSHELGYIYNVLMNHIRVKLLDGKSAGLASETSLIHALNHRGTITHNFKSRPGLIASIVKYRKEIQNGR
ncbi:MAG: hypothetical protein L0Y79_09675 [Chlorobi bacterium]|nr:hypothetical protein [Chlorobiota bacterium]MCI0714983.1 hypothetical protein [Chlorobiota bacterium]